MILSYGECEWFTISSPRGAGRQNNLAFSCGSLKLSSNNYVRWRYTVGEHEISSTFSFVVCEFVNKEKSLVPRNRKASIILTTSFNQTLKVSLLVPFAIVVAHPYVAD
jgi:hypothetical protein